MHIGVADNNRHRRYIIEDSVEAPQRYVMLAEPHAPVSERGDRTSDALAIVLNNIAYNPAQYDTYGMVFSKISVMTNSESIVSPDWVRFEVISKRLSCGEAAAYISDMVPDFIVLSYCTQNGAISCCMNGEPYDQWSCKSNVLVRGDGSMSFSGEIGIADRESSMPFKLDNMSAENAEKMFDSSGAHMMLIA